FTSNYNTSGINSFGGNEKTVKGLSRWPHTEYLNIWVTWRITGGVSGIAGYATFPINIDPDRDGIVMRSDYVNSSNSSILAHEAGHYLNLFHTFEGSNSSSCPPNNNCNMEGDMCCDTRPHKIEGYSCDETDYYTCDNSTTYDF